MARLRLGVVSDTHGLVRDEALSALAGVDHLLHAGDIGDRLTLDAFARIAPMTAVRGNVDQGEWAQDLPEVALVHLGGVGMLVFHQRDHVPDNLAAMNIGLVVTGHSHRPGIELLGGIVYVNPGSAGPRRFSLPLGVADALIEDGRVDARLIPILSTPSIAPSTPGLGRARAPRANPRASRRSIRITEP